MPTDPPPDTDDIGTDDDYDVVDALIEEADLMSTEEDPDDDDAVYEDDTPGVYDYYTVTSHFIDEPGVRVMPPGRPAGVGKKVVLGGASLRLRVEFAVARVGGPPELPDPTPADPNAVYVGGQISPANIDYPGDGVSPRYRVTGIYDYEFLDRSLVNVAAPVPPFVDLTPASGDAAQVAGLLNQSVIDTAGAGGPVNPFPDE
ncbi:hypothetical protein [Fimbriiglobus ruber]|uniref:Uncharacterized protein n=1 Tax=Fimbriiglobus ruber TaxID=1908690 RepID=A0A225DW41_9BACT|nr:hypothetical protein [Fimbriiglobus ruber]OWK45760.1 hypothetical protein FRUB_02091 [Fimbriiglobus ruber]